MFMLFTVLPLHVFLTSCKVRIKRKNIYFYHITKSRAGPHSGWFNIAGAHFLANEKTSIHLLSTWSTKKKT